MLKRYSEFYLVLWEFHIKFAEIVLRNKGKNQDQLIL
jgi:hypothetical protein